MSPESFRLNGPNWHNRRFAQNGLPKTNSPIDNNDDKKEKGFTSVAQYLQFYTPYIALFGPVSVLSFRPWV